MSPSAPTASPVAGLRKERPGWAEILHLSEQPRVGVGGRGAMAAGVRGPNKQGGARDGCNAVSASDRWFCCLLLQNPEMPISA